MMERLNPVFTGAESLGGDGLGVTEGLQPRIADPHFETAARTTGGSSGTWRTTAGSSSAGPFRDTFNSTFYGHNNHREEDGNNSFGNNNFGNNNFGNNENSNSNTMYSGTSTSGLNNTNSSWNTFNHTNSTWNFREGGDGRGASRGGRRRNSTRANYEMFPESSDFASIFQGFEQIKVVVTRPPGELHKDLDVAFRWAGRYPTVRKSFDPELG
jgi:hypothetical protein